MCDTTATVEFTLPLSSPGTTDGTVTEIKVYYTDRSNFEAAVRKSDGVAVSLASFTITAGDADVVTDTTDKTVTLAADASFCGCYTHICAVIVATVDVDTTNDDACIALQAGSKTCTGTVFKQCLNNE